MKDFTTEIAKSLYLDQENYNKTICEALEEGLNALLEAELSGFLGYEKYDYDGRGSGDSRNGSYERIIHSQFGPLHVNIPRDRNGSFFNCISAALNLLDGTLNVLKEYGAGMLIPTPPVVGMTGVEPA